jgi:hypothetical protein
VKPRRPLRTSVLLAALLLTACRDDPPANASGSETESAGTSDSDPTVGETEPTGGMTDTEGETESDTGPMVDFEPAPGGMRKLLFREYHDSVEMMLGEAAADAAIPPADIPDSAFDAVGAWVLPLTPVDVEDYEDTATQVAAAAAANKGTLAQTVPCVMPGGDNSCYESVARDFGRFAFRRHLTDVEVDQLVEIAIAGKQLGEGDFDMGLQYELMAILQAPSFLYIQQVGQPDAGSGYRLLKPEELASRMAFFLTGKTPSLQLLDMAEAGGLATEAQIRELAQDLVQDPGARIAMAGFFDELLRTRDLSAAAKSAEVFPNFTPELGEFMRQETLLLVHDIVWNRDSDFRELFNASYTFVNDPLAELYGMQSPGQGNLFVQANWPANQNRAGYLSQASFLTHQSGARRNSPTKRGKYVQTQVLCNNIPPPDPTVDPVLPDDEGLTLKELLELHMQNPSCATCHALTDPVGFAFEHYNAIGEFRTMDEGQPVEADGEVQGIGEWNNARELADLLAADPRTSNCFIQNLIKGTLGHLPTDGEEPAVEELDATFGEGGYSVQALMVEFVSHPLFRVVEEPK